MGTDFYNKVERKIKKLESFGKNPEDNSCIYHYTSPEHFKSIIINKELYLSDINFLNDKEENNYIYKVLGDILLNNSVDSIIGYLILIILCMKERINPIFLTKIKDSNFNSQEKEKLLREYFIDCCKKQNINKTESIFCFSASLKKDILPMWNYYSKNGKYYGYNIGFNIKKLICSIKELNDNIYKTNIDPYNEKIIYDFNEEKQSILKIFNNFVEKKNIKDISKIDANLDYKELIDDILFKGKGISFKNKSFSHEEEYRIAIRIEDTNNKEKRDCFIKNGIFVPYIKIRFDKTSIDSITIAPLVEKDIAKKELKQFLINNGYEVYNEETKTGIKIETSNCPIRY